jgi:hypothetical protein
VLLEQLAATREVDASAPKGNGRKTNGKKANGKPASTRTKTIG